MFVEIIIGVVIFLGLIYIRFHFKNDRKGKMIHWNTDEEVIKKIKCRFLLNDYKYSFGSCDVKIYDDFILLKGYFVLFKKKIEAKTILLYTEENKVVDFDFIKLKIVAIRRRSLVDKGLEIAFKRSKYSYPNEDEIILFGLPHEANEKILSFMD